MTNRTPTADDQVQVDPHEPPLRQAERALRDKFYSQAIRLCREAIDQKPEPLAEIAWRLLLGRAYLVSGQAEQSVPQFVRVTQLHPAEPTVYVYLGAAYNKLTHYKLAVEALTQALKLNRSSFETYFNLGVAHRRLGDLSLAKTALREALSIQPNSAVAHFQLASAYLELGTANLATTNFQKVLAIRPNFPKAQEGLTQATIASRAGSGVYLNPLARIALPPTNKTKEMVIAGTKSQPTELDPEAVRFLSNEITRTANELRQQLENTVGPLLNAMRRLVIEGKSSFPDFRQHHADLRSACIRNAELRKKLRRMTLKLLAVDELQKA